MIRSLFSFGLLLLSHAALAQNPVPFQIFPDQVHRDGPLLILLADTWPSGCGGTVSVETTAEVIELIATSASSDFCPAAVTTLYELIDPLVSNEGVRLADTVTVNYRLDGEFRFSRQLSFAEQPNTTVKLQTGSWGSELANHGLFLDRQGDVLTAAMFDYDSEGQATWYYAVGRIDGTAYSADLIRYAEIQCVAAPCSRAAPQRMGRINLIFPYENLLVGSYLDALESPLAQLYGTMSYQRLQFDRSAGLPPGEFCCQTIPDLAGVWLGGIPGDGALADDLGILTIRYAGPDSLGGDNGRYLFEAFAGQFDAGQEPTVDDFRFALTCGAPDYLCRMAGAVRQDAACQVEFHHSDVGVDRVNVPALCDTDSGQVASRFMLYRQDD